LRLLFVRDALQAVSAMTLYCGLRTESVEQEC